MSSGRGEQLLPDSLVGTFFEPHERNTFPYPWPLIQELDAIAFENGPIRGYRRPMYIRRTSYGETRHPGMLWDPHDFTRQ